MMNAIIFSAIDWDFAQNDVVHFYGFLAVARFAREEIS